MQVSAVEWNTEHNKNNKHRENLLKHMQRRFVTIKNNSVQNNGEQLSAAIHLKIGYLEKILNTI